PPPDPRRYGPRSAARGAVPCRGTPVTPEQTARLEIDRQLTAAGWTMQDHKAMNLGASLAIAVREFPLETGPVDYLLYAGGKVIGIVEAKPEGHTLKGVEIQNRKYTLGVPAH